jgi:hypothetical protein
MLILNRLQVEALLDVDALIDALAPAMADLSAGRASVPDRVAALVPEHEGFLAAMPGFVPSAKVLMSKLVSLFPHNAGTELPTHQAVIVAFDPDTGQPVALLDGTAITAIRTGACSALSARLLARPDADVLAILGTGVQARSHARAMCRVMPIRQIRVAGRDYAKAAALAAELSDTLQTGSTGRRDLSRGAAGRRNRMCDDPRGRTCDPAFLADRGGACHLGGLWRPGDRRRHRRRCFGVRGIQARRIGSLSLGQQRPANAHSRWRHHRGPCLRRVGRACRRDQAGPEFTRPDHALQIRRRRGAGRRSCGSGPRGGT